MLGFDEINNADFFSCKYCKTPIPFFATAAVYGMILLFGREQGYYGLVCPRCKKTNLRKYSRENIESLRTAFNGLGYATNGFHKDLIGYYSIPHHWGEWLNQSKHILGSAYIPMSEVNAGPFSIEGFIDYVIFNDEHPAHLPDTYSPYLAGDRIIGPVMALYWFKEDSIDRLAEKENQSGVRQIPRYVFYDEFIESVEHFCWEYHTILDYYNWQASQPGIEIIKYDNYPTRIEHAKNFDFLDIISGKLEFLDQGLAVFPTSFCNLPEKFNNISIQADLSAAEYDEIDISGRRLKPKEMAEELWAAFKKEGFQDQLSILSKRFILEYTDKARQTTFSKEIVTHLRFKYLKEAYESIGSSRRWVSIYRQVPKVEEKRVQEAESLFPDTKIISRDSTINHMKIDLVKYARIQEQKLNFLLLGETGTGKELFAKAIHEASGRKGKFVPVNCTTIPANLFDSLLFGHRKGAFTDAKENSKGFFVEADRGTIFLDEIGDLALELQPKILRVIQEGEIQAVGSSYPKNVDVRVIFGTNRDLSDMVEKKEFRLDLYERIKTFQFNIPALRQRKDDIPLLIEYFISKFDSERKVNPVLEPFQVSEECMQVLKKYPWNGNVRELEGVFKKIVIDRIEDKYRGDLNPSDLPPYILEGDMRRQSHGTSQNEIKKLPSDDELLRLEREGYTRKEVANMFGYSRGHISRCYSDIRIRVKKMNE